jgi:hypothetical protein
VLLKLMLCPILNLCSVTVDFSSWPRLMYLMCSIHLVSMILPVCPQYIPVAFRPNLSCIGLCAWMFF